MIGFGSIVGQFLLYKHMPAQFKDAKDLIKFQVILDIWVQLFICVHDKPKDSYLIDFIPLLINCTILIKF